MPLGGWKGRSMKRNQCRVILVSCGTLSEAKRIARAAVEQRIGACVSVVLTPVESVYRWKNKIETSCEYLLVIKSVAQRLPRLERLVQRLHSYEVPEFIVLPIVAGSHAYLGWLVENAGPARRCKKRLAVTRREVPGPDRQ
jgi:periplasmic divalent cation tolerance protein